MDVEKDSEKEREEKVTTSEFESYVTSSTIEEALKDLPDVLSFIKRLQECILRQRTLIHRLYGKLKEDGSQCKCYQDASTQTNEVDWQMAPETGNIVEDIKQAAQDAVHQTGFVYEATSGMYYDYNTGYYYNAELGLYYDGHSGTYYYFDESSKSFQFHSQVNLPNVPGVSKPLDKPENNLDYRLEENQENIDQVPPWKLSRAAQLAERQAAALAVHLPNVSGESQTSDKPEDNLGKRLQDNQENINITKIPKKMRLTVKEEGECSESSSESETENEVQNVSDKNCDNNKNDISIEETKPQSIIAQRFLLDDEIANAWPPCLRVVVKETSLEDLLVGSLFIVTCTGGSLGRQGDHAILIPDINISKHHAKVTYSDEGKCYTIVDLGSRNGTFVDGTRISVALRESEPVALGHGSEVRVGGTTLLCHLHPGRHTCRQCEPGCALHAHTESTELIDKDHETKEARHRSELRRLRKKFGLDKLSAVPSLAAGYQDRAEERRKTVGSQDHHAKTEAASVYQSIQSNNKGFKMLAKMGWAEGQSIGKDSTKGITEPVLVEQRPEKSGLGSEHVHLPPPDPKAKKKTEIWKKAQQRFLELDE